MKKFSKAPLTLINAAGLACLAGGVFAHPDPNPGPAECGAEFADLHFAIDNATFLGSCGLDGGLCLDSLQRKFDGAVSKTNARKGDKFDDAYQKVEDIKMSVVVWADADKPKISESSKNSTVTEAGNVQSCLLQFTP